MKKNIRYLVMDVDGTLTDGKIYMGDAGEMMKAFDIKDGYAINEILREYSITPVIITGRKSQIVLNRCKELNITEIHQGVKNKLQELLKITDDLSNVAYIGDDIPDISCMEPIKKEGGIIGCPANAVQEVKKISDFITLHNGGDGAVREFIEWICE